MLRYAGLAKSTYYAVLKSLDKKDKYHALRIAIKRICKENKYRYGYRRVTMQLKREGFRVNHKVVMRLMKEENLTCKVKRSRYNSYKGEAGESKSNIIKRNFKAATANKKWATDVTEFKAAGKKLYLSAIIDMYNSEVISYSIAEKPNLKLVLEMLGKAIAKTENTKGIILHSDQGWQYKHAAYQKMLKESGIIQSMSRKGNCLDNALMENFWGILKTEMYYGSVFERTDVLKRELVEYIEYYNNKRIKEKLHGLSPVEFRLKFQLTA